MESLSLLQGIQMLLAYKAEYEHTNITIEALLKKYQLDKEDIEGYEEWRKPGEQPATILAPLTQVATLIGSKPKTKKQTTVDKIIMQAEVVTPTESKTIEQTHIDKIEEFKVKALDHCLKFMNKDAQFSEVKEFKDIVAIVDSLEKSYQKVDPDAGKPTINILINNLMARFQDDC